MDHSFLSSSGDGGERGDPGLITTPKSAAQATVNDLQVQIDRLHRENFNLKMNMFYLEEKIKKLKGGEEDLTEHYRELEEMNTSLEYEKYELEKKLEEAEQNRMEVNCCRPVLPSVNAVNLFTLTFFESCVYDHQLQGLLKRSKNELHSMQSNQGFLEGQRSEDRSVKEKMEADVRARDQRIVVLDEKVVWLEHKCEELREDKAKLEAEYQKIVEERDMLNSRIQDANVMVEEVSVRVGASPLQLNHMVVIYMHLCGNDYIR